MATPTAQTTLTLDVIREWQRKVSESFAVPSSALREPRTPSANEVMAKLQFCGTRVHYTTAALETTDVRKFPASRHRSKRIHKKLCKRFGGEYVTKPAIWKTAAGFYIHPALKAKFEAAIERQNYSTF